MRRFRLMSEPKRERKSKILIIIASAIIFMLSDVIATLGKFTDTSETHRYSAGVHPVCNTRKLVHTRRNSTLQRAIV